MKRIYQGSDIRIGITIGGEQDYVGSIKSAEIRFYTFNKENCIIKSEKDIENCEIILEWTELEKLEQGVLYYDLRYSMCDNDLVSGSFESLSNIATDYYLMTGNDPVIIDSDIVRWGDIKGDITKQKDLIELIRSQIKLENGKERDQTN